MNRDDLLKKCADRGVADQGSIESVSHLFYVYLLSALQKGQRVEVPNFGTFGTRVVGVKRARKMPYFETEKEFADKVNDRYRELKYLVVGKYELSPVPGDEEYRGREMPHDPMVDHLGKEKLVDTQRDITLEEYERNLALSQSKEKKTMPKLNLKGEGMEEDLKSHDIEEGTPSGPMMREMKESKGPSPVLQAGVAILLLGLITYGLNHFGVIHLWGDKPAKVSTTETLPEPEPYVPPSTPTESAQPPAGDVTQQNPPATQTPTPVTPTEKGTKQTTPSIKETPKVTPRETPKVNLPTSGSGQYTVQVSSWATRSKAEAEVGKLTRAGLDAFVTEASVAGETKYRVRVGRYSTEKDAATAATQLSNILENGIWVARISQ